MTGSQPTRSKVGCSRPAGARPSEPYSPGGASTIGSPTALRPDGLSHYAGGIAKITLLEPDYSQPYMFLAPLKTTTVTAAPFDYGGLALASGGELTLKE